jgi:hypothetical protein
MPLSPEAQGYSWAWGAIQSAVAERASTAQVFAAVQAEAERAGYDTPPGMFAAVNELRGLSVAERRGAETFQRSAPEAAFDMSMAAPDINARGDADRSLFPEYLARFDMTYITATGEQVTSTYTMRDTWAPNMTVQDVQDAVMESAAGLSNDYGVELVDVGNIRPVTI